VLARIYTDTQLARFTALRLRAGDSSAATTASTLKLAMAESARRARNAAFTVLGADGMLAGELQDQALASFALSIAGGTDEIQRNLLGERVLGLPR